MRGTAIASARLAHHTGRAHPSPTRAHAGAPKVATLAWVDPFVDR
jgi:hypothetical protein